MTLVSLFLSSARPGTAGASRRGSIAPDAGRLTRAGACPPASRAGILLGRALPFLCAALLLVAQAMPALGAPSRLPLAGCGVSLSESGRLVSEPFGASAPLRIRNALAERMATGRVVQLNMVVILADFSDRPARSNTYDVAYYRDLFFSRGTHPTGSMADYYYENSGGQLLLGGEVFGWFRMPERYQTYVSGQAGLGGYPNNSQGFVEDAVRAANRSVNYARFDNDGADDIPDTIDDDTMIDLLLVIHAGSGGESSGSATNLQSIAFTLPNPTPFDGVFANEFAIAPEDANLGVYAHETGHLFGLPDLYDQTGRSFGLGTWSLMAGGWSLDEARTPAHMDPWCKAQIGFITPVNVAGTRNDVVFDPVEAGGTVYRLAPGGALDREYFLVENRRRTGFDRFLPGDGLLIYHINELRPTNNIPLNYRVGVEQADGLYQLENLSNGPSFGDAGDLWTEESPSRGFGRFTVPDSRLQSGQETGVTVYHIRGPDPSGRVTADLRVTVGPSIRIESLRLSSLAGDGDEFAEPGETIAIRPELIVSTGTAHDVVLRVRSNDPLVEILDGEIELGDLPVGTHGVSEGFGVRIGPNIPTNPYGADFTLDIDFREEVPLSRALTVALGDLVGLVDDFENPEAPWPHRAGRVGFYDLWRFEVEGGRPAPGDTDGGRAWHCGNPTQGFRGGTDAILETPLFILPPSAHLILDQLMEAPRSDSGDVIAGGFVEISLNGGEWRQVAPRRGYDQHYFGDDDFMDGRAILTGDTPGDPEWETLDFDLSSFSGGARLRFRFFSAATVFFGKGWWLDNVRVVSGETPVALGRFEARHTAAGAELNWTLTDAGLAVGLHVYRGSPGGELRLTDTPLVPAPAGSFVDPAPPIAGARYRLEAIQRTGGIRSLGELWLDRPAGESIPPLAAVQCAPNPTRGVTQFSVTLRNEGVARLRIFDSRGRLVQTLLDDQLPAGTHAALWNGRDATGQPVPAGIYLYRLDAAGRSLSRKVVVSR